MAPVVRGRSKVLAMLPFICCMLERIWIRAPGVCILAVAGGKGLNWGGGATSSKTLGAIKMCCLSINVFCIIDFASVEGKGRGGLPMAMRICTYEDSIALSLSL